MIIQAEYVKYCTDLYFISLDWLEPNAPQTLDLPKCSRILVGLSAVLGLEERDSVLKT